VQRHRAAAPAAILQHRDAVVLALPGGIAQGVLPREAAGNADIDMRAGFEGRQILAERMHQLERTDALGLIGNRSDA